MFPVILRDFKKEDEAFIYSSWLKSFRDEPTFRKMPNEHFFTLHRKIVEGLIATAKIKLLVMEEDKDHLLGFICFDNSKAFDILHFMYIKTSFRKLKLSRVLLDEALSKDERPCYYTHHTYGAEFIAPSINAVYYPYRILNYE